MTSNSKIGDAIRERREALGMTRRQLGQLIGCTGQMIGRYEGGAEPRRAAVRAHLARWVETASAPIGGGAQYCTDLRCLRDTDPEWLTAAIAALPPDRIGLIRSALACGDVARRIRRWQSPGDAHARRVILVAGRRVVLTPTDRSSTCTEARR